MKNYKTAIVVGASSGIGAELVRQLAQSGCRVAALARRKDRLDALAAEFPDLVLPIEHDVTDFESAKELFLSLTHQLGGLDLFIYNSGVMPPVEPFEYSLEKDRQMIDVNVTGAVAWLNLAAERFGNTGRGVMVGVSSVAGERGRRGQPVYNASKAFLTCYLEALRNRLAGKGVTVTTIKPGPVATEMISHLKFRNAMSAQDAAKRTLRAAASGNEVYLNPIHRFIFMAIRNVPSVLFRRIPI